VINNPRFPLILCVVLIISACSSPQVYSSDPLTKSKIFLAEGIDNPRINFIWLELPDPVKPGEADVRLFIAKTSPPEPILPSPNELRCELSSADEYAILGPERLLFEFKRDDTFAGSYTFRACPECIECYINWDTTLEMTGVILPEGVDLEIAIKHLGHNVQGSFVRAELKPVSNVDEEPRIICDQEIKCQEIDFFTRE
jgi:hypothetical protein